MPLRYANRCDPCTLTPLICKPAARYLLGPSECPIWRSRLIGGIPLHMFALEYMILWPLSGHVLLHKLQTSLLLHFAHLSTLALWWCRVVPLSIHQNIWLTVVAAWKSGPRLSGHQVIRGALLYRSCTSQGTEVDLLLHGPGHLFSVAFEHWHSSALMISTWAPT